MVSRKNLIETKNVIVTLMIAFCFHLCKCVILSFLCSSTFNDSNVGVLGRCVD